MKMLRRLTILMAVVLAPIAFGATITAQSAVTYNDGGQIKTLAAGESLEIPDGSTFSLARGSVTVTGTAKVDVGTGVAVATNASMYVEVKGNNAKISNVSPTSAGQVSFVKASGVETIIETGNEIIASVGSDDSLTVVEQEITPVDLPDLDVTPVGTNL